MKSIVVILAAVVLLFSFCPAAPGQDWDPNDFREVKAGDSFHRQVIQGAVKLRKEGKLKASEVLRLRTAMLSPAFRAQAKELAKIQMAASGELDSIPMVDGQIDWDKLGEFIEKLIPLIIQLLEAIVDIVGKLSQVDAAPDWYLCGQRHEYPICQVAA